LIPEGGLAADRCTENGLVGQRLSGKIIEKFNHCLPPFWSHVNSMDWAAEMSMDIHTAIVDELLERDVGRRMMIQAVMESTIVIERAYDKQFKKDSLEQSEG
jgi:acyl-CoA synthetase (NDP forming)